MPLSRRHLLFALPALVLAYPGATDDRKVGAVPPELVTSLGLKPFYNKHVSAGGLPVLSSEKVSDFALLEAAYLIDHLLSGRDDIRQAMIRNRVRCAVMAYNEMTTAIPEHSDLTPAKYWDRRARGLGASPARPAVSGAEENLLGYPGDPYAGENILIHEFSHAIHQMGLRTVEPEFGKKLQETYQKAMDKGLWKSTYAATNRGEYWAEGVQSWFDCNQRPNPSHNDVRTRERLTEYDPDLAAVIDSVFPDKQWRYRPPADRKDKAHLQGYDPRTAPRFEWPKGLDA